MAEWLNENIKCERTKDGAEYTIALWKDSFKAPVWWYALPLLTLLLTPFARDWMGVEREVYTIVIAVAFLVLLFIFFIGRGLSAKYVWKIHQGTLSFAGKSIALRDVASLEFDSKQMNVLQVVQKNGERVRAIVPSTMLQGGPFMRSSLPDIRDIMNKEIKRYQT